MGLDLRKQGIAVHAWTHRQVTAERALARGLVDQASVHPQVLHGCALVLLALPLDQLVSPPPQLLEGLPGDALVMDMGSVKGPVLASMQHRLPRFVACHPMAGTANAGVEAGVAGLFAGRPWVITPSGQEVAQRSCRWGGCVGAGFGLLWFCRHDPDRWRESPARHLDGSLQSRCCLGCLGELPAAAGALAFFGPFQGLAGASREAQRGSGPQTRLPLSLQ